MNYYNQRDNSGFAALLCLLMVVAGGGLVVWLWLPNTTVDLSGVGAIAPYLGLATDTGRPIREVDAAPAAPNVVVATAVVAPTVVPATTSAPRFCSAGQQPSLARVFGPLQNTLGDRMGTPLECDHVNTDNGDTLQQTSTGLAIFRPRSNLVMFTNGWRHWAITPAGLVTWDGEVDTPPPPDSGNNG